MFWPILIIVLTVVYFFLEGYQFRYFFEKNYLVLRFSQEGIRCGLWNSRKQAAETFIFWHDINSCKLVQGFDSNRWWYRNVKQKFGLGIYNRLLIHTKSQSTFVFHLLPEPILSKLSPPYKHMSTFNSNRDILKELAQHHIPVEKKESSLIEAVTNKRRGWYNNK